MPPESPDQNEAKRKSAVDDFGLDDAGKPCPITWFNYDALTDGEIQTDERLKLWADGALAMLALVNAANTPERAGRRARLIAFFLGHSDCKSQLELANKLDLTPAAVSQQLNSLHADFARIRARFSMSQQRRT